MAKFTSGLVENRVVAAIATAALIRASGGEDSATIERTKKPVAIASVMKDASLTPSDATATLDSVQHTPVMAM